MHVYKKNHFCRSLDVISINESLKFTQYALRHGSAGFADLAFRQEAACMVIAPLYGLPSQPVVRAYCVYSII